MQHAILGLLLIQSPLTLYAIQKAFTQGISLFYSASFGSIQRALRQLVESGFVEAVDAPDSPRASKPYRITPEGAEHWRTWMFAPLEGSDFEKSALAKTFFLGLLDDPADRARVIGLIRARIDEDLAGLAGLAHGLDAAEIPAEFAQIFAFQRATLDYGIRAHEQARDWFGVLSPDTGTTGPDPTDPVRG